MVGAVLFFMHPPAELCADEYIDTSEGRAECCGGVSEERLIEAEAWTRAPDARV